MSRPPRIGTDAEPVQARCTCCATWTSRSRSANSRPSWGRPVRASRPCSTLSVSSTATTASSGPFGRDLGRGQEGVAPIAPCRKAIGPETAPRRIVLQPCTALLEYSLARGGSCPGTFAVALPAVAQLYAKTWGAVFEHRTTTAPSDHPPPGVTEVNARIDGRSGERAT